MTELRNVPIQFSELPARCTSIYVAWMFWVIISDSISLAIVEFSTRHLALCNHVNLSGCGQFKLVETSQNQFLVHMTNRNSVACRITPASDFNKRGCVRQI